MDARTFIGGRFRAVRELGRGGHSVIWEGEELATGRRVAIKVMALESVDDWRPRDLFESSTRALRGLRHAGLPRVEGFEALDSGELVLVREVFDHGTLEERVRGGHRMDPREFRALLRSLLELLEFLHTRVPPILHRDIKPSNIMFRGPGLDAPVLVDFDTVAGPNRTGMTIVGTPGYAAPEQFAGEASPASDLYGLGATMLFAATGVDADALPRQGGRFLVGHLLASLDERTRAVVLRMVEPSPQDRFGSASEALAALDAPPAARSDSRRAPQPRKRSAGPPVLVFAGAAAVALVAGGVMVVLLNTQAETVAGQEAVEQQRAKAREEATSVMEEAARRDRELAAARKEAEAERAAQKSGEPPVHPMAAPEPPRPEPAPAACEVVTHPAGATVFRGDEALGETPLTLLKPQDEDDAPYFIVKAGFMTVTMAADRPTWQRGCRASVNLTPLPPLPEGKVGELAYTHITTVMTQQEPHFWACSELLPGDVEAASMRVKFRVRRDGTPYRITTPDLPASWEPAGKCVREHMATVRFPAYRKGRTIVDHQLRLR